MPERPAVAGQRRPRHGHDHQEDREPDEQAQQDEAQRRERLDADLDEQVAGAPRERERAEQDGVAGCRARRVGGARPSSRRAGSVSPAESAMRGPRRRAPRSSRRPPLRPRRRSIPYHGRACAPFVPSSCQRGARGVFFPFIAVILAARGFYRRGSA